MPIVTRKEPAVGKYTTDRRLWLTKDRERVVEEGDPEAAFLLASAGKEIDAETAARYGLGEKAAKPATNKAVKAERVENKGVQPEGQGGE